MRNHICFAQGKPKKIGIAAIMNGKLGLAFIKNGKTESFIAEEELLNQLHAKTPIKLSALISENHIN